MQNSKAIVTLAIGEKYLNAWKKYSEPNWKKYADKHGFDLIVVDQPLDTSERARKRSPAWQKLLILSQEFSKRYERIVWIDSDILINYHSAPDITVTVPLEKVGAAEEMSTPTPQLHREALQRASELWGWTGLGENLAHEYYHNMCLPETLDKVVQCGVLVFSPTYHRELLETVYYKYEDKGGRKYHMEQPPLSYELLKGGMVEWIDTRFNMLWHWAMLIYYPFLLDPNRVPNLYRRIRRALIALLTEDFLLDLKKACITTIYFDSFFLHVGGADLLALMKLVDTSAESWRDITLLLLR